MSVSAIDGDVLRCVTIRHAQALTKLPELWRNVVQSGSVATPTTGITMALGKDATARQIAESYWRAECARDIERVGQHYHSDAIFKPPGDHLMGWNNIRKWYEASFRQFPGLEVEIVHEIANGKEASLEWKAVLIDSAGVRHSLTGVNIVRVEDGKYREVRAYFDPSSVKLGQR